MPEESSDGPDGPERPEPVVCPVCDVEFEAHDELERHMDEEHEE